MAAWPTANGSEVQERYTASHVKHDGKRRQQPHVTTQPIDSPTSFDNLGLSLVSDGRALSEVSSFHTASLSSTHSDHHVSVAQSYHNSHRSGITIGGISIISTFLVFVIAVILITVAFKNQDKTVKIVLRMLRAAGLFGFAGGLTNWLGIKLIFNKIPGIVFSGAVTKQFVPAKNLVANFILESFFSHSQVRQYLEEKKGEHLTPEHLDNLLEKSLNSVTVERMINYHVDALMGTPEGLRLRMLGVTKAKLLPLVIPYLSSLKVYIVPLLLSSVELLEVLNAEQLREQIVDLILTRTHGLSAPEVKRIVKDAVYKHLSWLVFWGSALGAVVGCLAEVTAVYGSGILT